VITLVASLSVDLGTYGGTTAALNTAGANLIAISVSSYGYGPAPTVTDSKGNTYIGLTSRGAPVAPNARHRIYYVLAPAVGANT